MPNDILRFGRRGQVNLLEQTVVLVILIIFFFMFVIGAFAFDTITKAVRLREMSRQETLNKLHSIYFLEELQCTEGGSINPNCIDMHKARSFKSRLETNATFRDYYRTIFGSMALSLEVFDPSPEKDTWMTDSKIVLYDNKKERYRTMTVVRMPVSYKNMTDGSSYLGVLDIRVFT